MLVSMAELLADAKKNHYALAAPNAFDENDVRSIIEHGKQQAYLSVNAAMIDVYWHIGKRIVEEEQHGLKRAGYGTQIIDYLSEKLSDEYGENYSPRYLRSFRRFYTLFPDFDIWKSRFPNLTWTHIYRTMRVGDDTAIRWYLGEASAQMWSVRTLDRNISTQYFERHISSPQIQDTNKCCNNY